MAATKRKGLTKWMHAAGWEAAKEEKGSHGYTNRTGLLEATTVSAVWRNSPNLTTISLEMPMSYAAYVVAWAQSKGLPNIVPIAEALEAYFDKTIPRYFMPGSRIGAAGARLGNK